jgi:hypothetical protein
VLAAVLHAGTNVKRMRSPCRCDYPNHTEVFEAWKNPFLGPGSNLSASGAFDSDFAVLMTGQVYAEKTGKVDTVLLDKDGPPLGIQASQYKLVCLQVGCYCW